MFDCSDALTEEAHRRMLKSCASLGMRRADAEDVTQEVWIWLLGSRALDPHRLRSPWLEAVTRNFVRRHWRESFRRRRREQRWQELLMQGRAPIDRDRSLEARRVLKELNRRLSGKDKRVLSLVRLGFTFGEASVIVGVPRGSRHRIYRRLVRYGQSVVAA